MSGWLMKSVVVGYEPNGDDQSGASEGSALAESFNRLGNSVKSQS